MSRGFTPLPRQPGRCDASTCGQSSSCPAAVRVLVLPAGPRRTIAVASFRDPGELCDRATTRRHAAPAQPTPDRCGGIRSIRSIHSNHLAPWAAVSMPVSAKGVCQMIVSPNVRASGLSCYLLHSKLVEDSKFSALNKRRMNADITSYRRRAGCAIAFSCIGT